MSAKSKVAKGSASPRSRAPVSAMKSRVATSSTKKSVRLEVEDDLRGFEAGRSPLSSAGSDHLSERDTENEETPSRSRAQQEEESRREEQLEMTIRMAKASKKIAEKLPVKKTAHDVEKRDDLFSLWDVHEKGILSRSNIDEGIHQTLGLEELQKVKPAVRRAFRATKLLRRGKQGARDDEYIGRADFRVLLEYLKMYFELYHVFTQIAGHERQIDIKEFRDAAQRLYEWGALVDIKNPDETFNEIDSEESGRVAFINFTEWAIKGKLAAQMAEPGYADTQAGSDDSDIDDEVGDINALSGDEMGAGVVLSEEELEPAGDDDLAFTVTSKYLPGAAAVSLATTRTLSMKKSGRKLLKTPPGERVTASMSCTDPQGGSKKSTATRSNGSRKTTKSVASAFKQAQIARIVAKEEREKKLIANQVELWKRHI